MNESPSALPMLPVRPANAHKGTFGTVAIIGGCARGESRMIGAPAIAARAALRSGVGLARMLTPEPILNEAITITPSATGVALATDADGNLVPHEAAAVFDEHTAGAHAIVLGPGLGWSNEAGSPLAAGTSAVVLRAALHAECPLVLDADALNCLAATPDFQRDLRAPTVITPHPGEFARLAAALSIKAPDASEPARLAACEAMAQRLGCVVVLKGMHTVVSNGHESWTCRRGHACLATAGTGDVLAGLLGGLIAQFVRLMPIAGKTMPGTLSLMDCVRVGVEAHAIAGERWAAKNAAAGLLALELADLLPEVLDAMRAK
ncbi:MAG TPA: NAD(P)H-hydrate dehydratase [Phycisphaerales bacterium]